MELQQSQIIKDTLQRIDRKDFLLNVITAKGLLKLSPEILRVNQIAVLFHTKDKADKVFQFLICLDFLVKGVLIHGQFKNKANKGLTTDAKFPILLGDQYHSMAYYMITRLGNIELTKLLTLVEEGFWKIFFNVEAFGADMHKNL